MNYRIMAVDMDGTLLNSRKQVSPTDRAAVNRALEAGKEVVFSTGRCVGELAPFFPLFPKMRYAICESGSCIYDIQAQKPLLQKSLDPALVKVILEYAEKKDICPQVLTHPSCMTKKSCLGNLAHYQIPEFEAHFANNTLPVEDLLAEIGKRDWIADKICLYHTDTEAREETLAFVQGMNLVPVFAERTSLEVTAPGAEKGLGLEWLCNYLGCSLAESIAVGDNMNDESVLRRAGLPCAVGNAVPEIKAICKAVVADHDHGGVAEVVDRFLLNCFTK